MSKMNEFIEALRNEKGYDWICNHGHELNKIDLIQIIKEYDYGIYNNTAFEYQRKEFYKSIADELNEWYGDEDEKEEE